MRGTNEMESWREMPRDGLRRRQSGLAPVVYTLLALLCLTAGCAAPHTAATKPSPTAARVLPTGSPTATPTAEELLLVALAKQAVGSLTAGIEVTEDASSGTMDVTATLDNAVPSTAEDALAAQERVQIVCFRVQQALWTSGAAPHEVQVAVMGQVITDFGDTSLALYGVADLRAATAKSFAWASLDPVSAWDAYDGQWLRTGYRPNQSWGVSTPTPGR